MKVKYFVMTEINSFQMSTSSYPGMAQSFTMSHGTNMTTVAGMRQDAMGKYIFTINNNKPILCLIKLQKRVNKES